ncbi:2-hydroxyacid dehydrogenase [Psittacicella gerlachiana]|uniref:2-hydroxyacid dehydrogenase n=1 Tax=Psittacicella gerlachiana TaxID=2028574 RepID=A0A3A1YCZ7_9GAMM|nr:2-hydroxyacid dehydrogenase [Psittacicella gerlachiana]RIY35099.1 2-hydroxyacid dehydrogenase [Psittacicella gerlachiana]
MNITLFSSKSYDKEFFDKVNVESNFNYNISYVEQRLDLSTVDLLEAGQDVVCIFVNDDASRPVLEALKAKGVKIVALRCAGFNNVDLEAAKELGFQVVRVPAYSPESVAEHAAALLFTLNRNTHKAYNRTKDANFNLENLTGICLYGKTAGVIGTGKIGLAMIRILRGLGMRVVCVDPYQNQAAIDAGAEYVDFDELYKVSDVISVHCPLFKENTHFLNKEAFAKMKDGVILINSSRGGLLNTEDALEALASGKLRGLGLDVYEYESALFFKDLSNEVLKDDLYTRLIMNPRVLLTGHQAFLTEEALTSISNTTLSNIKEVVETGKATNTVLN